MAYGKRRTYRRKRTYRKKRTYKKKKISNKTHMFKRNVELLDVASGATDTFGAYNFSLNDVPGVTEFEQLYDSFRINMVKVSFIPLSNVTVSSSTGASTALTAYSNRLFTVIDKNDSVPAASIDELRQYSTVKWSPNSRIHKRIIYPRLISETSGAGTYNVKGKPWIAMNSTASLNSNYYGLKWGLEGSQVATQAYRVEAVYYLEFKSSK